MKKRELKTPLDIDALKPMALQSLDAFLKISTDARGRIDQPTVYVPDVLTTANTVNDMKGLISLSNIRQAEQYVHRMLANEPVVARIVCVDAQKNTQIFLITPVASSLTRVENARVVSYRSPLGRIASQTIGETISLPGHDFLTVVEREEFNTRCDNADWDSIDTRVHAADGVALTIQSLRDLFRDIIPHKDIDPLEAIFAGEAVSENVVEGFRRERLQRITLREKPILDSFQDAAFRLPLSKRVVLMGPPGSGKTTTLIKRLGQKLDLNSLDEDEVALVRASRAREKDHRHSWLMFSPTDLLKAYVKEAFNKEGVPAPDENIQTWDRFRETIGRGILPILRSGVGGGTFFLRDNMEQLLPATIERSAYWFDNFDAWQRKAFWADLYESASRLAKSDDAEVRAIGVRIGRLLPKANAGKRRPMAPILDGIGNLSEKIESIGKEAEAIARGVVSAAYKEDNTFLLEFGKQAERLRERGSAEADETDDDEEEDNVATVVPRTGQRAAFDAYFRLVKQLARSVAAKRALKPSTRLARLLKWLDGRIPSDQELEALGRLLQDQADLRVFRNPARRLFSDVPRRYRQFRREMEISGDWYKAGAIRSSEIASLELDVVILAMLRIAQGLLEEPGIGRRLNDSGFEFLLACADLQKTQIVVDEATDFSPVQLACMAALCDPAANSLFACGDFRQRMTQWGSRSEIDLQWVSNDIEVREINITYRQSRLLNDFTHRVTGLSGGAGALPLLPPNVKNEGVSPVLGVSVRGHDVAARWLARRIEEIERLSPPLPTVAVVVPSEEEVTPLAHALNLILADQNLKAVGCVGGRFIGEGSEIRVFDVRYIKGLEFEAVFFVGLDSLAKKEPDLFDKYLYVGATRAATYLGVTVGTSTLPSRLSSLKETFQTDWSR